MCTVPSPDHTTLNNSHFANIIVPDGLKRFKLDWLWCVGKSCEVVIMVIAVEPALEVCYDSIVGGQSLAHVINQDAMIASRRSASTE